MKKMLVLLAALLLAASALRAQPVPLPDPPDAPPAMMDDRPSPEQGDSADQGRMGRMMGKERQMLEAVRISRMTEELGLSDEQIAKFFPRMHKMEDTMRDLDRQRRKLITELDRLLQAKAKDAELRSLVEQLDKLDAQKFQRMEAEHAELDKLLTVEQRAKLRVFNHRFDDEIRSMVRGIREKRMRQLKP